VLLAGCAHSPVAAVSGARLGEAFDLKVGEARTVASEELTIEFQRVVADSRCPQNVQCIRAGDVTIRLGIARRPTGRTTLDVTSPSTAPSSIDGTYSLTVVDVMPYPDANRRIDPDEYVARLLISR
jgi:hypothetical protein